MKNTNIADSVFLVNLKYVRLQNETKELFFRCLQEHRDLDYFKDQIKKIWGNLDHSYLDKEIDKYTEVIHTRNIHDKEVVRIKQEDDVFELVPESVVIDQENKFVKVKEREYKNALNSSAYKKDEDTYLKNKVQKYTSQTVPYFPKVGGKPKYVELSTYASMIHNTNLTRAGWNTTIKDADEMNQELFYIPYHPFSCPHCVAHQNRILTKRDVINLIGRVDTQTGDILHPNCKCTLTFYMPDTKFNKPKYSYGELEEQYNIRQKTNSLTLQKEKIKTDIKIQKSLGNQDVVDELNNMRNSINKKIRELQSKLPTESLKKQVVAINREKIISSNKYVEQARKNIIKKEQNKTKEKLLKETKRNKEKLNQMKKLSSQTHKEMQELFKIRENRPKYMEQLERKQQELKNTRKIIKQKNNDMKYWKAKQQELSLKVDIKNLKDLINK